MKELIKKIILCSNISSIDIKLKKCVMKLLMIVWKHQKFIFDWFVTSMFFSD